MATDPQEDYSKRRSAGFSFGLLRLVGFGFLVAVLGSAYYLNTLGGSSSMLVLAVLGVIGIAFTAFVLSKN